LFRQRKTCGFEISHPLKLLSFADLEAGAALKRNSSTAAAPAGAQRDASCYIASITGRS
jgi:hypothetical protein